jgi:hypothetical protein
VKTYHILNGDSLKDQFPTEQIKGEIIVMKECLIDGPSSGKNLVEFFQTRSEFIKEVYGDSENKYKNQVIPEITKIVNIESGEVNLWFEDDLFCQVNLWFVCSLLYTKPNITVNLVRPNDSLQYGFGGLSKPKLIEAFNQRIPLTQINVNQFTWLWFTYQKNHVERLLKLSVQLSEDFPFIKEAIIAQIERKPIDGEMGRPEKTILDIIKEKSSQEFGVVFKEFCKREPIYGFGDLQFKRIYDNVLQDIS